MGKNGFTIVFLDKITSNYFSAKFSTTSFRLQMPHQQLMEQTVGLFVNPFCEQLVFPAAETEPSAEATEERPSAIVADLLDELIDTVVSRAIAAAAAARSKTKEPPAEKVAAIHPLHNHLLLYCQVRCNDPS